jgi:Tfp pilus assembly protein PilF
VTRVGSRLAGLLLACAALAGCPSQSGSEAVRSADASEGGEVIEFEDEAAERSAQAAHPATPLVQRGEALLARGDAAAAETLFREAIAADARDARALLDLGLAREMQDDAPGAVRAYRDAIAADARFAEAHNNLGALLRETGELPGAVAALRESVRLRPESASAQSNLALALEESEALPEAEAAYRAAVRLAPRDPMARVNLGLLLLRLERKDDAARALREALPLAEGNRAALAGIGSGLRRAAEPEAAARALQAAVDAGGEPPTSGLLCELALAQRGAGDRPGAEATLGRVLAADERYATAHYLLANMLAGRGALAEAITHFERYLALEPRGPQADEARTRRDRAREAQGAATPAPRGARPPR